MKAISDFLSFRTVRARFLAANVPLVVVSMIILFTLFQLNANRVAYLKLDDKLNKLVDIQSLVVVDALWNMADEQITLMLDAIAIDPDVAAAAVYDESGDLVGSIGESETNEQEQFAASRDISFSDGDESKVIGRLTIRLTDKQVRADIGRRLLLAYSIGGGAFVVGRSQRARRQPSDNRDPARAVVRSHQHLATERPTGSGQVGE